MAVSIVQTLEEIEEVHRAKPRGGHPLWVALMEGALNKGQVQEFLRQFSVIPLYNHLYHGRLYVNCPDPIWRQRLAEVCYEEATGRLFADGVPHYQLYLRIGEAMGIPTKEMYDTEFGVGAIAFRAYFEYICSKSFLEGVSAHMLGAEAQVPGVSGKVGRALMKRFGLSEHDVAFYTVHDDADKEHKEIGQELLEQFAKTDEELRLVVRTVRDMVDVSYLLYDDIYRRVQSVKGT